MVDSEVMVTIEEDMDVAEIEGAEPTPATDGDRSAPVWTEEIQDDQILEILMLEPNCLEDDLDAAPVATKK